VTTLIAQTMQHDFVVLDGKARRSEVCERSWAALDVEHPVACATEEVVMMGLA
jgi:hypothetical protein